MDRPWLAFYPEGVPYEVEIPDLSLYDLFERSSRDYPDHPAVIDGNKQLTYSQLKNATDRLASALYCRGFQKGERIAVMLPNSMEYIVSFYAIQRLGGVVVQVNPMYQTNELDYLLRDSDAKWFIGYREQIHKLEQISLNDQLTIIVADGTQEQEDSLYRWIAEGNNELPPLDIRPEEDLAVLQYTGGTTGRSKGVMLTHSNLVSNLQTFSSLGGMIQRPGECFLGIPPLFHVLGLSHLNMAILNAAAYICVSRFEASQVLELIRKHRPTVFPGVPTMYIALLQHPDFKKGDLDSLKLCLCGSAPMPVEVIQEFEQKTGKKIYEGYGLSETSSVTHRNPITGKRKPGSIGLPLPNTDAKIVDSDTGIRELSPGEPGELIIKGPHVMKGYWKNPDETNLAMRDGWLYTGDIATMDEDGYFYIAGRKKDLIIAGGYNIYPVEVEEILYQHPAVAEACVFGVPDPYRGETVKAAIVPRQQVRVTEQEIINWCIERMAKYKVPRLIEFRNTLPKSTVGKILRRKLVEEEQEKLKIAAKEEK